MNPTTAAWGGLTLGAGSRYRILTVEGWEELPPSRYDKQGRASAHGSHPSRRLSDERIVTVTGYCWSATERDQLLAAMQSELTYDDGGDDGGTRPLAVTLAGRTLTAQAQLIAARQMVLRGEWGIGRFGWLTQWRCPNPLRYGASVTQSTPLPAPGGGLLYPLYSTSGKLDYGAAGTTGRIALTNSGTADAAVLFTVRGALPEGYELSGSGQRIRSPKPVPAGQVIEIDTAAGTVLVEGTASRRGDLTIADWMLVPRATRNLDTGVVTPGSLEVQFTSLGGVRDPSALLTATVVETYW